MGLNSEGFNGLRRRYFGALFGLAFLAFAGAQRASADTYTDRTAFLTAISALPGSVSTQDFESLAANASISDGDTIGAITFNNSIGLDLMVFTGLVTTSPSNYLGVDFDDQLFQAQDQWGMTFTSPVFAVGMYFITSSDGLLEDDIRLVTDVGTASNSSVADRTLGTDLAYFVGLTSNTSFDSVEIQYGPAVTGIDFVYNVDDITTVTAPAAVPEPSSMLVLTFAASGLFCVRRVSRRKEASRRN